MWHLGRRGCSSRPAAVRPPDLDPAASATQAISDYDTDRDQALSKEETAACPALRMSFTRHDTDGDGKLSASEIATCIKSLTSARQGLKSVSCTVLLDGQPLEGANVVFEPESFLTGRLKPAHGITSASGKTPLSLSKDDLPPDLQNFRGMQVGLYKVRVTHPSKTIPERCHTHTVLGEEVAPGTFDIQIHLKSN